MTPEEEDLMRAAHLLCVLTNYRPDRSAVMALGFVSHAGIYRNGKVELLMGSGVSYINVPMLSYHHDIEKIIAAIKKGWR